MNPKTALRWITFIEQRVSVESSQMCCAWRGP